MLVGCLEVEFYSWNVERELSFYLGSPWVVIEIEQDLTVPCTHVPMLGFVWLQYMYCSLLLGVDSRTATNYKIATSQEAG